MATASTTSVLKYLDDVLKCSICTEQLNDPRVLPCIHTFCLNCIDKWAKDKARDGKLACPLCRKEMSVPIEGMAGLPKNFFVEKLLDVGKLSRALSVKEVTCDVCSGMEKEERKDAVVYCTECRQNMCKTCVQFHCTMKILSSHKVLRLDSELSEDQLLRKLPENLCDKHPEEKVKLYCFDCQIPICFMCYITDHNSHKCSDVNQVAQEMNEMIKDNLDRVAGKVPECHKLLQELTEQNQEFDTEVVDALTRINDAAEKMVQIVENCRTKLVSEVTLAKKEREKKVEMTRHEIEARLMIIDSFVRYSGELRSKGSACDIARAASSLHERAKELTAFDARREFAVEDIKVTVDFRPRIDSQTIEEMLGELQINRARKSSGPISMAANVERDGRMFSTLRQNLVDVTALRVQQQPRCLSSVNEAPGPGQSAAEPSSTRQSHDVARLSTSDLYGKIRVLLSDCTQQNAPTKARQIRELSIDTEERLRGLVEIVYEQVVDEPKSAAACACLSAYLSDLQVPTSQNSALATSYLTLLVYRCQHQFKTDHETKEDMTRRKNENRFKPTHEKPLEVEIILTEQQRRTVGNIRFIGEMFVLRLLTAGIMNDCIVELLRSRDEDSLEHLCILLEIVGQKLKDQKMSLYITEINTVINKCQLSAAVRARLQYIVDRRGRNWSR